MSLMLSLKDVAALDDQDALEERAEELASALIALTRADIRVAHPDDGAADDPEHVYGLASLKATWMETLMIGRWISEAKKEILEAIEKK